LLQDAIASGRAHLKKIGGYGETDHQGERIGWIDGDRIYLFPDVAYAVAQKLGNEVGNGLTVGASTLRKRLHEKGLIAEVEPSRKTLLVRKRVDGERSRVLAIFATALSGGKKGDQSDPPPLKPHAGSVFYPPWVSPGSVFLDQSDPDNTLNDKDLSLLGQIGHLFPGREDLRENSEPFLGQFAPEKTDPGETKTDPTDPKTDPSSSESLLISPDLASTEETETCSNCGVTMQAMAPEGVANAQWQCPNCGEEVCHYEI
jgi:hypothetical protein